MGFSFNTEQLNVKVDLEKVALLNTIAKTA
jgi:hypothetical protein